MTNPPAEPYDAQPRQRMTHIGLSPDAGQRDAQDLVIKTRDRDQLLRRALHWL
ncbi:protein of unknown function [Methylocella tundrae]|uniref:Uncharacterized protein n=1 Tax=Methylocella tundrae TaxID=227605 RepID=A0A4U8Z4Z3_METTU|nr:protein of unknown function [Methylocella tundrae]